MRIRPKVERKDREQDRQAPHPCVEKELQRGLDPLLMPPYADYEVHRNQGDLEEDIQQQQIHCAKETDHTSLHHKIKCEILARELLLPPSIEQRQKGQQRRQ